MGWVYLWILGGGGEMRWDGEGAGVGRLDEKHLFRGDIGCGMGGMDGMRCCGFNVMVRVMILILIFTLCHSRETYGEYCETIGNCQWIEVVSRW